jgi:hypothetical protein
VPRLSREWVEFVESGVSILVGTRDEALRPEAGRGCGAAVTALGARILVLVPELTSARTCENAAATGRVAVTFSRPFDHRALQAKGSVIDVRAARDADRAVVDRYVASYVDQLYLVGIPRAVSRKLRCWPAMVIELEVEALFVQTPGIGAGRRLEEAK